MKKKFVKIKSTFFIGHDGSYTMFETTNPVNGGAIISGTDPLEVVKRFKEATCLAYAVRSLTEFKNGGNFYIPVFE